MYKYRIYAFDIHKYMNKCYLRHDFGLKKKFCVIRLPNLFFQTVAYTPSLNFSKHILPNLEHWISTLFPY